MNDTSNPHFVAPVKPVDPLTRGVLRCVDRVATMVAARYLVVGAMARDLVLVNAFGLRSGGATRDIDFGLSVENWEAFQMFKTALVETAQFEATPKVAHRLNWKDPETGATTPVDLIPFGGVASEDKTIAWPPNQDFVMSVAGFEEASESAIRLQVEDGLIVRVASIPGLTVLKLIAWERRRNENNKDAADLRHLLLYYGDAGNLDRLYEQEMPCSSCRIRHRAGGGATAGSRCRPYLPQGHRGANPRPARFRRAGRTTDRPNARSEIL